MKTKKSNFADFEKYGGGAITPWALKRPWGRLACSITEIPTTEEGFLLQYNQLLFWWKNTRTRLSRPKNSAKFITFPPKYEQNEEKTQKYSFSKFCHRWSKGKSKYRPDLKKNLEKNIFMRKKNLIETKNALGIFDILVFGTATIDNKKVSKKKKKKKKSLKWVPVPVSLS